MSIRLFLLQVLCLSIVFVEAAARSLSPGWRLQRRCALRRLEPTIRTTTSPWSLLRGPLSALEVRGGASQSPPDNEEEEEEYDADEEDEEEEATNGSRNTDDSDIEIRVADEEEWNTSEPAIEEAEADIEVMLEMEAEESEESDINNKEPDAVPQAVKEEPVAVVPAPPTPVMERPVPIIDDGDSSTFVDRMELADAYDEGESTSFENEATTAASPQVVVTEVAQEAEINMITEPEIVKASNPSVEEGETAETLTIASESATETTPLQETEEPASSSAASEETSAPSQQQGTAATDTYVSDDSESTAVEETITEAMKESLRKLGYSRDDITRMKPSIAVVVIDKELSRPVEGLPDNWYLSGKQFRSGKRLAKVIAKIVLPILAAAAAIKGGMELAMSSSSGQEASESPADVFRPMTAADMLYYSTIVSQATGKGKAANSKRQ